VLTAFFIFFYYIYKLIKIIYSQGRVNTII